MKTDNELIAEFMGDRDKVLCDPKWMKGDELVYLRYHLSWDWLMPVVEKIEKIELNGFTVTTTLKNKRFYIITGKKKFSCHTVVKINSTYRVVVEFIRWYNTQNQTN